MKKTSLVTQAGNQTVTVRSRGVPVILIKSKEGWAETVMAVNFLRTGCLKVQLVIANGHEALLTTHQSMNSLLLKLQLPEEKFWLFEKPKLVKGGFTVMTLSYHPTMKEEV